MITAQSGLQLSVGGRGGKKKMTENAFQFKA